MKKSSCSGALTAALRLVAEPLSGRGLCRVAAPGWTGDSQLLPVLGHGARGQSDAALSQPVGQRLIGEGFFGRFLADQIAQPGLDRGGRYLLAVSAVNAGGKEILELENAARGVNVFFGGGARDG